jgi:hypothetical protein
MNVTAPSSLASDALARRLAELVGDERNVQVDFLLHLDEFDRRRAWAEAGFPSLWEYALRVLHLREGAAFRRISAMRVLRRLPQLADALRDGRLCLSTVALLGPVLTDDNAQDLVASAAFKTKAEVEKLVVALAPRTAPKDGLRRLGSQSRESGRTEVPAFAAPPLDLASRAESDRAPIGERAADGLVSLPPPAPMARPTVRPVTESTYSLHLTLDARFKAELDELTALLGHKVPNGDLRAVLLIAVQCAIAHYGKRKGAKAVRQTARAAAEPKSVPSQATSGGCAARRSIPAEVRREVWRRDGGQCTWLGPDGQRCPGKARLEFDHIQPVALGGASTVANIRLTCKAHNLLHAERVFGREHMARFGANTRPTGGSTSPSESEVQRGLFPAAG